MDIARIMTIVHHRYPFLLIDRILEIEQGVRAVGLKNVSFNEEIIGMQGDEPVLPDVLLVEHAAQIGCVLILSIPGNEEKMGLFAGMEEVEFRKKVTPGDQLITEVIMLRVSGRAGKVHFTSRVAGETVAEGRFTFLLVPAPNSGERKADAKNGD